MMRVGGMNTEMFRPECLITVEEPGLRKAVVEGVNGADSDLRWHLTQRVTGIVSAPLHYRTNYLKEEYLQDLLQHNNMLVVSPRMREVIEPWLKDYEFIPVNLELNGTNDLSNSGGGTIVHGWWWLNSWRRLDLVDFERSRVEWHSLERVSERYKKAPPRATVFDLVLHEPAPADEHFFGLTSVAGDEHYISEALHEEIVRQNLKVWFRPKFIKPNSESAADISRRLNAKAQTLLPQSGGEN